MVLLERDFSARKTKFLLSPILMKFARRYSASRSRYIAMITKRNAFAGSGKQSQEYQDHNEKWGDAAFGIILLL
jgi:hypothetical protein